MQWQNDHDTDVTCPHPPIKKWKKQNKTASYKVEHSRQWELQVQMQRAKDEKKVGIFKGARLTGTSNLLSVFSNYSPDKSPDL